MIEVEPASIISLVLILFTAFFFAPLGLGGGVLFVPIFLYIMGWGIQLSLVSSLILVLMVSMGSRSAHSEGGYAVQEIGKYAIPPALLGAIFGAIIGSILIDSMGDFTIKFAAASLLIWVIIRTLRQLAGESNGNGVEAVEPAEIKGEVMTRYRGMCLAGGTASGLLGIGGGMLFVTLHRSLFAWKPHYAAGTSYIIETWMVPIGVLSHLVVNGSGGDLLSTVGTWIPVVMLLVYVSAWLGAKTAIKMVPQQVLTYPFLLALVASLLRYCLDIFGTVGII
tara:strand:- start:951 stop:1790 length:840 start_codon:yes stop_codon:yes gene_type:complete